MQILEENISKLLFSLSVQKGCDLAMTQNPEIENNVINSMIKIFLISKKTINKVKR